MRLRGASFDVIERHTLSACLLKQKGGDLTQSYDKRRTNRYLDERQVVFHCQRFPDHCHLHKWTVCLILILQIFEWCQLETFAFIFVDYHRIFLTPIINVINIRAKWLIDIFHITGRLMQGCIISKQA